MSNKTNFQIIKDMEKHRNKCAKITCHNEKIRKGQGFCREHFLEISKP